MKIAIVSDTHFGVHRSSDMYIDSQRKFFDEQFIPFLDDNAINTVIIPGDVFDTRNSINVKAMNFAYEIFEKLSKYNLYIVLGNHDSFYTNTIDTHSLIFLKKFPNIKLIDSIQKVQFDDKQILFVPWQTDDTFIDYVKNQKETIDVCIGHFDISEFYMTKHNKSEHGYSKNLFNNFKLVISGHFHKRSKQGNIIYVGTPYSMDRNDIDEEKGFMVFDTENITYEFINNEVSFKFVNVEYGTEIDANLIKGNIVDIWVKQDEDFDEKDFQEYQKKISDCQPLTEPKIHFINEFVNSLEMDKFEDLNKDDKGLIIDYLNEVFEEEKKKETIKKIMFELHDESKGV
jgi:DNA repair exonuclease SbcCD nuclease subunit